MPSGVVGTFVKNNDPVETIHRRVIATRARFDLIEASPPSHRWHQYHYLLRLSPPSTQYPQLRAEALLSLAESLAVRCRLSRLAPLEYDLYDYITVLAPRYVTTITAVAFRTRATLLIGTISLRLKDAKRAFSVVGSLLRDPLLYLAENAPSLVEVLLAYSQISKKLGNHSLASRYVEMSLSTARQLYKMNPILDPRHCIYLCGF